MSHARSSSPWGVAIVSGSVGGRPSCHPERSEGSRRCHAVIGVRLADATPLVIASRLGAFPLVGQVDNLPIPLPLLPFLRLFDSSTLQAERDIAEMPLTAAVAHSGTVPTQAVVAPTAQRLTNKS